jgi:hypothetical protein
VTSVTTSNAKFLPRGNSQTASDFKNIKPVFEGGPDVDGAIEVFNVLWESEKKAQIGCPAFDVDGMD